MGEDLVLDVCIRDVVIHGHLEEVDDFFGSFAKDGSPQDELGISVDDDFKDASWILVHCMPL